VLRAWRLFDNGLFAGAHAMLADFKRGKNTARSFAPEELVARAKKVVAAREGKQKIPAAGSLHYS
jgi:hypothetical protein